MKQALTVNGRKILAGGTRYEMIKICANDMTDTTKQGTVTAIFTIADFLDFFIVRLIRGVS